MEARHGVTYLQSQPLGGRGREGDLCTSESILVYVASSGATYRDSGGGQTAGEGGRQWQQQLYGGGSVGGALAARPKDLGLM